MCLLSVGYETDGIFTKMSLLLKTTKNEFKYIGCKG